MTTFSSDHHSNEWMKKTTNINWYQCTHLKLHQEQIFQFISNLIQTFGDKICRSYGPAHFIIKSSEGFRGLLLQLQLLTIKKHLISQYRIWWCLYIFLTRRNAILSKAITVIIPKVFCIGPMHLFIFSIFWFLIPCQSFIVKLLEGKLTSFSAHFLSAIKLLLNSLCWALCSIS